MTAALTIALRGAVDELRLVTPIVQACLASMTTTQKADVHAKLAAAGVSPDGLVRANEREAVINAGAATLAESADADFTLTIQCPYSFVSVTKGNLAEHASMRARQVAGILRVMPADDGDYSDALIRLAATVAGDLVRALESNDDSRLLATQLTELLLLCQGERGGGDLLWLCIQIANEIDATQAAMVRNACEVAQ